MGARGVLLWLLGEGVRQRAVCTMREQHKAVKQRAYRQAYRQGQKGRAVEKLHRAMVCPGVARAAARGAALAWHRHPALAPVMAPVMPGIPCDVL